MAMPARDAAPSATRMRSAGPSGLKYSSTHRDRSAGGSSSGRRVVAPTRRKSAGRPFWKMSWMYAGMLVLSGA